MSGITIVGSGYALPKRRVSNEELSRTVDTDDAWIVSRTGIRSRYFAGDGESVHALALEAAEKALDNAARQDPEFSPDKISAVLVATMTSQYVFPSTACILQKELKLPETVRAFDLCAACTGFVYALQTAREMLSGMEEGYVLVAGSECMSRVLDFSDRASCILFGDGAGALVIKPAASGKGCFYACSGTQGNTEDLYCRQKPYGDGFLHMNGQQVYRFATTALRRAIETLLQQSEEKIDNIDYIICHQANARIIESVKRKYPEQAGRFFMDLDRFANTSAASVAIAVADLFEQKKLHAGMKVILAAFGAGLSWNAVLMTV